jgi:hypothetical protein
MIKKFTFAFCCVFISFFKAQVLDEYPENQDFYEGGIVNFYKEAHDYLINNNLKECGSNEIYQPRILITKDAVVKIIKDYDTLNIKQNKCAYDLSMGIIKNLKNWKPAEAKGMKLGAITDLVFYPKDLMSNYKEKYVAYNFMTSTQYPGGIKAFKKDFHDGFMMLFFDYHITGDINLEFYVDKDGYIVNPRIYPQINDKDFNIDFLRTLARLKKIWKPALYSNIPIKQRISYPMKFSMEFYER